MSSFIVSAITNTFTIIPLYDVLFTNHKHYILSLFFLLNDFTQLSCIYHNIIFTIRSQTDMIDNSYSRRLCCNWLHKINLERRQICLSIAYDSIIWLFYRQLGYILEVSKYAMEIRPTLTYRCIDGLTTYIVLALLTGYWNQSKNN